MKRIFPTAAIALAAVALLVTSTRAQDAENESDACWEAANTQLEMTRCAAQDMDAAEARMGLLYAIVLDKFRQDPETLRKIRSAQEAWLAFRQAHVAAIFPKAGTPEARSEYGSSFGMCLGLESAKLTGARIAQLREWAEGIEEGDVCAGSRGFSGD